jgi:hypothetical protein
LLWAISAHKIPGRQNFILFALSGFFAKGVEDHGTLNDNAPGFASEFNIKIFINNYEQSKENIIHNLPSWRIHAGFTWGYPAPPVHFLDIFPTNDLGCLSSHYA